MPATTKQKYSTLMNGYQEKIVKLRRTFYDLRLTRNKTSSNEDSVSIPFSCFYQIKIIRMIHENHLLTLRIS